MTILYGFFCLFFLIFFHETGHFVFARLCKVKVEAFSIGFGPVLLHKTVSGTDYRLSLIPFGGYCAMKGEKDFSSALASNLSYIEAEKDSLYGVHPVKRALIAFAGPLFNFLFAVFSFTIIALLGFTYQSFSNKILVPDEARYPELESVAKDAGILSGDKIIRVNKTETPDFSSLIKEIGSRPDEDITLYVEREGEEEILTFLVHTKLDKDTGSGKIGIIADSESLLKHEQKGKWIIPAIFEGFTETGNAIKLTLKGFLILFKGINVQNAVSGPIRVADLMGNVIGQSFSDTVKTGIVNLCSIMAVISVSLGIMNLLPLPVLDGGLILFALIEWISHRKMSPKVLYYIQLVGLALIITLFIFGLTGDVRYIFSSFGRK